MIKTRGMAALVFLVLSGLNLFAGTMTEGEDKDQSSAMKSTQECLKKGNCATMSTKEGQAADQNALAAVGGDTGKKQELYNISADIMPALLKMAGDDPVKMQEILVKAQTDPEAFLKSLPPDIQAKISNVAKGVEADRKPAQNP